MRKEYQSQQIRFLEYRIDRAGPPGDEPPAGPRDDELTTNLEYDDWYAFLGHKEMVGALLDRLRHRCTTIRIHGPSLRRPTDTP